jgi:GR25 family glycosyltransferase involved in LPS biosynthesis
LNAFVIVLAGHAYSEYCAERCVRTARDIGGIDVMRFEAVDAKQSESVMKLHGLTWTWGRSPKQHGYTGNVKACIGCAMSHFLLWQRCVVLNETILILEHDAVFLREFPQFDFAGICQINDPAGATKRGQWWHEEMVRRGPGVHPKTPVLPDDVPDGLAGNSAYVLKPFAAQELIEACHRVGLWPNDALMCRQFFPYLQELYPFVTRVEQSQSTTS